MKGNVGFSASDQRGQLINGGLFFVGSSASSSTTGPVGVDSWQVDDVPLHRPRNLLATSNGLPDVDAWAKGAGCTVAQPASPLHDGLRLTRITVKHSCMLTVLDLDLAAEPALCGETLYFLVQANLTGGAKGDLNAELSMMIDSGQGGGWQASNQTLVEGDPKVPGWGMHAFQLTMGNAPVGTAKFGLQVSTG